ncbi:Gfo/Idh/MocA family protein [Salidesulfovibrio onnuriiensis]|uniref:Gfo/Idh/MocA family protein n=1 Tax=Salidesulfovibrio onnuriiensis TaxID=2583823 RepID=UPI0011CB694C|nr:Gfo/Idh/MocA family oxidoreductase [Salidesulfovibrio onnuriiensis]
MQRFALMGCGRIAQRHADILGNGKIKGGILAAVCDVIEEKARTLGEKYSVPWFTNAFEMMETMGEKIDVISILTESGLHALHTIQMARYRKHIVVEKPMALRLADADEMIHVCDSAGIKLFVIKQNRYNYPVVKLREALEAGRFGKLVMGTVRVRWTRTQEYYDQASWRGTWQGDGGVFANQASHHVDLLEWMLGEPVSVFAKARTALVDIETEDTGVAVITFANGAIGIVEATNATRPKDLEGSLSVLGENGTVEIGGFAVNDMKVWNFTTDEPEDDEVLGKYRTNPPDVYGFGHIAYLEHVVDCIENGSPALVDGLEGRRSLELISAIYESIETGKEVHLRFQPKRCKLGESNGS